MQKRLTRERVDKPEQNPIEPSRIFRARHLPCFYLAVRERDVDRRSLVFLRFRKNPAAVQPRNIPAY